MIEHFKPMSKKEILVMRDALRANMHTSNLGIVQMSAFTFVITMCPNINKKVVAKTIEETLSNQGFNVNIKWNLWLKLFRVITLTLDERIYRIPAKKETRLFDDGEDYHLQESNKYKSARTGKVTTGWDTKETNYTGI